MNRWILNTTAIASLLGAVAMVPSGLAFAQQADGQASQEQGAWKHGHRHGMHDGLVREALKLDSLSPSQRASIEALATQRHDAAAPVRKADAQLLTTLASQIEQAAIDTQALAPALGTEQAASTAASAVDRDTLNRLHGLLTAAQRSELVDQIEAKHGHDGHFHPGADGGMAGMHGGGHGELRRLALTPEQKAQFLSNLKANRPAGATPQPGERRQGLEAFRGDSFDPSTLVHAERRGEWEEKLAQAIVPVLTPAQRSTLASDLRQRAARESGS